MKQVDYELKADKEFEKFKKQNIKEIMFKFQEESELIS